MSPSSEPPPRRIIASRAPIRILDNGGWTDTWFAKHGKVFNIGVSPYAEVELAVYDAGDRHEQVTLHVENYGDSYAFSTGNGRPGRHPLLEAAIGFIGIPQGVSVEITTFSEAPTGASTGTSAAMCVALIGALNRLRSGRMTIREVAYAARHVEVELLGNQCGIQDQLCSAYGGINFIEIKAFPEASVTRVEVPDDILAQLEQRLVLVYLGRGHDSSAMHRMVISELEQAGPECRQLEDLRRAAERSRDAVQSGNLGSLGRAMVENTEAQGRLHAELVGRDALRVIDIARKHGALGWKVNGAGGPGGSLTILCGPRSHARRVMVREICEDHSSYQVIPIHISLRGLICLDQHL